MATSERQPKQTEPASKSERRRSSFAIVVAIFLFAFGATAGGAAIYSLLASTSPPSEGDVLIDPAETVISGESPQEVKVVLTNQRGASVCIARITASCGCTVVKKPEHLTIEPGQAETLTVVATPPTIGEKLVGIEVYLEGESRPLAAKLTLKGREPPVPALNWQPTDVVARGKLGERHVENFELATTEQKSAQPWIAAATCDSPAVEIEVSSRREERGPSPETVRRKYPVSVSIGLEALGRIRLGSISLQLSKQVEESAPRPIAVYSDCRASVEAAPDTIFAAVSQDDLPKEFVIRFRAPSMKASLELQAEPAEVAWLEVDQPEAIGDTSLFCAQAPIRIIGLPADSDESSLRTEVRLRTNAPDCPVLKIPVYIQVKRSVTLSADLMD